MDPRGPLAFALVQPWFGACLNKYNYDFSNSLLNVPPQPPMSFWSSAAPESKDSAIASAEDIFVVFVVLS